MKAMTASAKGTMEAPGTLVSQKAGLNRGILDKGWGAIRTRTEHKVTRHGHLTKRVPAPWTSLTCPRCSSKDRENRPCRELFSCKQCGYTAHADVVAALNIKRRALQSVLAGGTPLTALVRITVGSNG